MNASVDDEALEVLERPREAELDVRHVGVGVEDGQVVVCVHADVLSRACVPTPCPVT